MKNNIKFIRTIEKQYTSKDILEALLWTLKFRDLYTYQHCNRVAYYAKQLAIAAGLSEAEVEIAQYSALLHDIGKIGIPDAVLLKKDKLDTLEKSIIQKHPEIGFQILQNYAADPTIAQILPGVLCHHERIDGKGYPSGLTNNNIPFIARIILIVDTYDAITSTRIYRPANSTQVAYQELKKYAGTQFDPDLVALFLKVHASWPVIHDEALVPESQKELKSSIA